MTSAAARLAESLWTDEQWSELIPLLEELTRSASDKEALRTRLIRLCRAYRSVGLDRRAIGAAARALELAPEDQELRRLNADLLFECKMWSEASRALEPLLAGPPTSTGDRVALLHRAGVCAARMGQADRACYWLGQALGLEPRHRDSLLQLLELVGSRPRTKLDILRALEPGATGEERLDLLVEMGDLLANQLFDTTAALEVYGRALELAPSDHILVHKCLDVLARGKRWKECRELFDRLIETESEAAVRAKYAHAAALLCKDELDEPEQAMALWWSALDDDPDLIDAQTGLEEILRELESWQALANLYLKLLAHSGATTWPVRRPRCPPPACASGSTWRISAGTSSTRRTARSTRSRWRAGWRRTTSTACGSTPTAPPRPARRTAAARHRVPPPAARDEQAAGGVLQGAGDAVRRRPPRAARRRLRRRLRVRPGGRRGRPAAAAGQPARSRQQRYDRRDVDRAPSSRRGPAGQRRAGAGRARGRRRQRAVAQAAAARDAQR